MSEKTETPENNQVETNPQDAHEDMLSRMMDFDYFAPQGEEEEGGESPPENLAEEGIEPEPGERKEVAEAPPKPPKTPEAPPANPELDELRRQLEELRETNKALLGVVQTRQPEQKEKEPEAPKQKAKYEEEIKYSLGVPDEIANLIFSEDVTERKHGINGLVNGLANTIHARLREEYQAAFKDQVTPLITSIPTVVGREVERSYSAREIVNDFYGTYKGVNLKQHGELVKTVAQAVFQQKGSETWNADVRDEIGKRVYQILGIPLESQTEVPKTPPKSGPPKMTPVGNTRGSGRVLSQQEAEMMEFLKYE